MRLFVALLLEPTLRDALGSIQAALRRLDTNHAVRWVDPSGVHLTLKFLGAVDASRVDPVRAAIATALRSRPAPRLALGRPGTFPNPSRPRVLWLGLRESGQQLAATASAVDTALAALGWEPEKRAFQPHVTVGRVRDQAQPNDASDLVAKLDTVPIGTAEPIPHPRVALMQSHLGPSGARYEEIGLWRLD